MGMSGHRAGLPARVPFGVFLSDATLDARKDAGI